MLQTFFTYINDERNVKVVLKAKTGELRRLILKLILQWNGENPEENGMVTLNGIWISTKHDCMRVYMAALNQFMLTKFNLLAPCMLCFISW